MRYMANIWPAAADPKSLTKIREILEAYCTVIQCYEIDLNYMGLRNYILQIYKEDSWKGSYFNQYRGVRVKADNCYMDGRSTWAIELESHTGEAVVQAKEAVREFCKREKHSIHTTDNEKELNRMKELLLHENSCWLMNNCQPDKYIRFMAKLNRLEKICRRNHVPTDSLIIVSDAVESLYNIRPCSKISFFSKNPIPPGLDKINDKEYWEIAEDFKEEIFLPENQVYFFGFQFITLELLQKIKNT